MSSGSGVNAKLGVNLSCAFRPFANACYEPLSPKCQWEVLLMYFSEANAKVSKWAAAQLKGNADSVNAQLCSLHVNTPISLMCYVKLYVW